MPPHALPSARACSLLQSQQLPLQETHRQFHLHHHHHLHLTSGCRLLGATPVDVSLTWPPPPPFTLLTMRPTHHYLLLLPISSTRLSPAAFRTYKSVTPSTLPPHYASPVHCNLFHHCIHLATFHSPTSKAAPRPPREILSVPPHAPIDKWGHGAVGRAG